MKLALGILVLASVLANVVSEENVKVFENMKKYFKSWASYNIPMRPIDPIEYVATEPLKSFYLGEFDQSGRLIRFTKYLKEVQGTTRVPLASSNSLDKARYLAAVKQDDELKPSAEITYEATEGVPHYFQVASHEPGNVAKLELIHMSVFFVDEYTYWTHNQLKTRTMKRKDGTVLRTSYDECGKETHNK